jgi:hypothetical protein
MARSRPNPQRPRELVFVWLICHIGRSLPDIWRPKPRRLGAKPPILGQGRTTRVGDVALLRSRRVSSARAGNQGLTNRRSPSSWQHRASGGEIPMLMSSRYLMNGSPRCCMFCGEPFRPSDGSRRVLAHLRRAAFLLGVLRRRRRGSPLPQAPGRGERAYRAACRRDPPLSQFRKLPISWFGKPLASVTTPPLPASRGCAPICRVADAKPAAARPAGPASDCGLNLS